MPILIQKYIFTLVPQQSPFFIRPIASLIFGQLEKLLSAPEIKKNLAMVRSTFLSLEILVWPPRPCCHLSNLTTLQIEKHLEKSKSIWFAGGQEPTVSYRLLLSNFYFKFA